VSLEGWGFSEFNRTAYRKLKAGVNVPNPRAEKIAGSSQSRMKKRLVLASRLDLQFVI
jgi:hypothetical protein